MSDTNAGDRAAFFLLGAAIGAAAALLMAPASGARTRRRLVGKGEEVADYLIEIAADSPDIRFDAGSIITVSAKSRSGPAITALGGNPAAGAASAPIVPPASPAAAGAPVGATPVAAASGAAAPGVAAPAASSGSQPDFTVLKDDFIPGAKTILYDDFTDMAPDEAPPHWRRGRCGDPCRRLAPCSGCRRGR